MCVVLWCSFLSPFVPSYIFVLLFWSVLLLVWWHTHYLHIYNPHCHLGWPVTHYILNCFLIFTGTSVQIHFSMFSGGSFASKCNASTDNVLKAPVYIFTPLLCILSSLSLFGYLYYIISNHGLFLICILHFIKLIQGLFYLLPIFPCNYLNDALVLGLSICSSQFNLLFRVILRNCVLSLYYMIWFLKCYFY